MATRRSRMSRGTTVRRKRVWARDNAITLPGVTGDGTAYELGTAFQGELGINAFPPGTTIGGIRFNYLARRPAVSANQNTGFIIGIGVFQETTIAQLPNPITDPHADWMFVIACYLGLGADAAFASNSNAQPDIAVKAQRRCEEIGEHLYIHGQPMVPGETVNWNFSASTLLVMP